MPAVFYKKNFVMRNVAEVSRQYHKKYSNTNEFWVAKAEMRKILENINIINGESESRMEFHDRVMDFLEQEIPRSKLQSLADFIFPFGRQIQEQIRKDIKENIEIELLLHNIDPNA